VERTKKSIHCLAAGIATVASLLLGLWIVSDSPRPSSISLLIEIYPASFAYHLIAKSAKFASNHR
jgi:hypothetical protein